MVSYTIENLFPRLGKAVTTSDEDDDFDFDFDEVRERRSSDFGEQTNLIKSRQLLKTCVNHDKSERNETTCVKFMLNSCCWKQIPENIFAFYYYYYYYYYYCLTRTSVFWFRNIACTAPRKTPNFLGRKCLSENFNVAPMKYQCGRGSEVPSKNIHANNVSIALMKLKITTSNTLYARY